MEGCGSNKQKKSLVFNGSTDLQEALSVCRTFCQFICQSGAPFIHLSIRLLTEHRNTPDTFTVTCCIDGKASFTKDLRFIETD